MLNNCVNYVIEKKINQEKKIFLTFHFEDEIDVKEICEKLKCEFVRKKIFGNFYVYEFVVCYEKKEDKILQDVFLFSKDNYQLFSSEVRAVKNLDEKNVLSYVLEKSACDLEIDFKFNFINYATEIVYKTIVINGFDDVEKMFQKYNNSNSGLIIEVEKNEKNFFINENDEICCEQTVGLKIICYVKKKLQECLNHFVDNNSKIKMKLKKNVSFSDFFYVEAKEDDVFYKDAIVLHGGKFLRALENEAKIEDFQKFEVVSDFYLNFLSNTAILKNQFLLNLEYYAQKKFAKKIVLEIYCENEMEYELNDEIVFNAEKYYIEKIVFNELLKTVKITCFLILENGFKEIVETEKKVEMPELINVLKKEDEIVFNFVEEMILIEKFGIR